MQLSLHQEAKSLDVTVKKKAKNNLNLLFWKYTLLTVYRTLRPFLLGNMDLRQVDVCNK